MAPSRYDWKIVDWDVKPQHNQPTNQPNYLVDQRAAETYVKDDEMTKCRNCNEVQSA